MLKVLNDTFQFLKFALKCLPVIFVNSSWKFHLFLKICNITKNINYIHCFIIKRQISPLLEVKERERERHTEKKSDRVQ